QLQAQQLPLCRQRQLLPALQEQQRLNKSWLHLRNSTSRVRQLCPVSVRLVTRLARTGSIHRHKARTRGLTKRCCGFRAWRKIHLASFTSAGNTRTCNTESTTFSCRKAFLASDRNWKRALPTVFRSSPARSLPNSGFATPAWSTSTQKLALPFNKAKPLCMSAVSIR